MPEHPRVFVSYTQESREHKVRVWNLCEKLRNHGIDCVSDHDEFSPAESWPQWCSNKIQESQFVLVVCTETYKRRHDRKEEPGKGLGATWEGHVITQVLYAAASKNISFIPVVFSPDDRQYIPIELYGASYYDVATDEGYKSLLRHITKQPEWVRSPVAASFPILPPLGRMQQARTDQAAPLVITPAAGTLPPPTHKPPFQTGSQSGNLVINIFDGTRQPMRAGTRVLLRIVDGNQKRVVNQFYAVPNILVEGLPIYNNFGDNYSVLLSADGYTDAGFIPIKISPHAWQSIDLMLLPSSGAFNFRDAVWPRLKRTHPNIAALLAQGTTGDTAAQDRYAQFMENDAASLASFFNLATAMSAINLSVGTLLDSIKEVIWDETFAQDRFFAWADPRLIDQVRLAAAYGLFAPEVGPWIFHTSATSSWKQIQFGEANIQLTFHESDSPKQIDGINCVRIEGDFNYYKDPGAHILWEVAVNGLTHSLTDPKQVYVLRWSAGRHAGVAEFNPPYVIE